MSDPQNRPDETPEIEAEGIDPDMPSTEDGTDDRGGTDDEDEDLDLDDLP